MRRVFFLINNLEIRFITFNNGCEKGRVINNVMNKVYPFNNVYAGHLGLNGKAKTWFEKEWVRCQHRKKLLTFWKLTNITIHVFKWNWRDNGRGGLCKTWKHFNEKDMMKMKVTQLDEKTDSDTSMDGVLLSMTFTLLTLRFRGFSCIKIVWP